MNKQPVTVVRCYGNPLVREVNTYSDKYDDENMADMFDPFNDYPHVKPMPIEEAVEAFKQFYRDLFANTRKNLKLTEWKESAEYRKADDEKWRKLQAEAELLLFRSAVAV